MRRAPPTVPGTPMSPSIPPRSFLAQKVIMRPRSAAASTWAKLPSSTTSGSGRTSCRTTHGSSPSPTSRFDPPPRNLCGMWFTSSRFRRSGRHSCFLMRSMSVTPPMPSEVQSASAVPGCSSTRMPMNLATTLGSGMRMRGGMLRSQQNHEFTARTADVARADGKNSVPGSRLLQQVLDAFLHGAKIVDVLVARLANGAHQRFTTDARDGRLAGRIDIDQHQNIRLIERTGEFAPKVLSARVAMRLKEHQQAIEFAAASGFERGANLNRVMTVVIHHGNVIHYALDVKAATHAGKFEQAFTDQISRNIQVKRDCRRRCRVADIVNARRMRQLE